MGIFTADNVHLLPGFPVQDNSFLRVAFYVLLPSFIQGGAVIPVATLLQVVNNSKSELEAVFGVPIAQIKLGYVATIPPTNQTSNVTTTASTTTQAPTITTTEKASDDWKWIVIGVVVGVVVIVIIIVTVYLL